MFTSSAKRRCTVCKRRLDSAIDEQIERGESCPIGHCSFQQEIRDAIELSKSQKVPEIVCWESNLYEVLIGKNVTIKWEVNFARKVYIDGFGEVPLSGEREITINESTSISLTIIDFKNIEYTSDLTLDIVALPLPKIRLKNDSFKIEEGQFALIKWQTENVSKLLFNDDETQVELDTNAEYHVNPNETKTYTFQFIALDNSTAVTRNILVEVYKKPIIHLFKIDTELILPNKPVYIEWQTEFSKKVEINFGIGEVASSGNKRLFFDENTRLLIRVYGELSYVEDVIDIFVFPLPLDKTLLVPIPEVNLDLILPSCDLNYVEVDFSIPNIEFYDSNYLIEAFNSPFSLNSVPKRVELEVPEYLIRKNNLRGERIINKIFNK